MEEDRVSTDWRSTWAQTFQVERWGRKNPKDKLGRTPLHLAAQHGHLKTCQIIVDIVGYESLKDYGGVTPLQYADYSGNFEIYQMLSKIVLQTKMEHKQK